MACRCWSSSSAKGRRLRITLPSSGDAIEPGGAVRLFSVQGAGSYTPAPDGTRFLVNEILESGGASPITVIVNWQQGDQGVTVRR